MGSKKISIDEEYYWFGPGEVLIPYIFKNVIGCDGKTIVNRDDESTQTITYSEMDINEYRKKYAEFRDGKYFWITANAPQKNNKRIIDGKNYWVGPGGVLIPDHINEVIAHDGVNMCYRDGTLTHNSIMGPHLLSPEKYRERYAEYKNGRYFWIENNPPNVRNIDGKKYWVGPANVLVPYHVGKVVPLDSKKFDDNYKQMIGEYREKYAELRNGQYFWIDNNVQNNKKRKCNDESIGKSTPNYKVIATNDGNSFQSSDNGK